MTKGRCGKGKSTTFHAVIAQRLFLIRKTKTPNAESLDSSCWLFLSHPVHTFLPIENSCEPPGSNKK